jgi:hypothetical protein
VSEEQQWLTCLSTDQLVAACKEAGVKVDGFRQLAMVPRLLLERYVTSVLTKKPWQTRAMKLRTALKSRWQERFAALATALEAGPPAGEGEDPERWGEWLSGLSRQFGRAPVLMGLNLTDVLVPPATTDPSFLERLDPFWPMLTAEGAPPPDAEDAEPVPAPVQEEALDPRHGEWRQERALLRAKLKALAQENQALQRARTSAEHRVAHYQSQVERVREELDGIVQRTDWPRPTLLVQRLIRGMMEARRQILDLELEKAELLAELGRSRPEPEEPDDLDVTS